MKTTDIVKVQTMEAFDTTQSLTWEYLTRWPDTETVAEMVFIAMTIGLAAFLADVLYRAIQNLSQENALMQSQAIPPLQPIPTSLTEIILALCATEHFGVREAIAETTRLGLDEQQGQLLISIGNLIRFKGNECVMPDQLGIVFDHINDDLPD